MMQKTFGLIGAGIFVGGALLTLLFSFVVSDSSSAEFTPLSDGTMANLVGGYCEKWSGQIEGSGEGGFADCPDTPPCVPTQENRAAYYPKIYTCAECWSGMNQYYSFFLYSDIGSWCEQKGEDECEYKSDGFGPTWDCQYQTGSTC